MENSELFNTMRKISRYGLKYIEGQLINNIHVKIIYKQLKGETVESEVKKIGKRDHKILSLFMKTYKSFPRIAPKFYKSQDKMVDYTVFAACRIKIEIEALSGKVEKFQKYLMKLFKFSLKNEELLRNFFTLVEDLKAKGLELSEFWFNIKSLKALGFDLRKLIIDRPSVLNIFQKISQLFVEEIDKGNEEVIALSLFLFMWYVNKGLRVISKNGKILKYDVKEVIDEIKFDDEEVTDFDIKELVKERLSRVLEKLEGV